MLRRSGSDAISDQTISINVTGRLSSREPPDSYVLLAKSSGCTLSGLLTFLEGLEQNFLELHAP